MNKKLLLGLSVLMSSFFGFSQSSNIDYTNVRDGESVEYCTTHKKREAYFATHPGAEALYKAEQLDLLSNTNSTKVPVKYIPIVFHLLHNNGAEKISDEQILDALDILNRDYALLNSDAANVHADFQGMPADCDIQFRLATVAPDGTCFKGITYTVSTATSDGDGEVQVNAIAAGNDVYQGNWPGNEYLNVFIVQDAGGAAGYTTTPNNWWTGTSMGNGIWILPEYVGSIGTGTEGRSRALTHECGHWLNLEHVWGPNNNPGNAASCGDDDGVADTPNCIGVTSCALNENTCGPRGNVENYMDYSYCSKMFTAGQVSRMHSALSSNMGGRSNIVSANNLSAVGADGNPSLCKADFSVDKNYICAGSSVQFSDESFNAVNGWTWTFTGGSPATSNQQNPVVSYASPGVYQVSLNATDGSNNDTESKTGYIIVSPNAASIPFLEDFEGFSSLTNSSEWGIYNPDANNAFELETNAGHTGVKSAKLINYNQATGSIDELIAAPLDLTGQSQVTMSFRYAYKRKSSSDGDWMRVKVTNNCGDTWVTRKTMNLKIGSDTQGSSYTTPVASDWRTVHITNITSTYFVNDFRYKFEFEAGGGNNIFIDNINIYPGASSDNIVVGLDELSRIGNITVYPNPVIDELSVVFDLLSTQKVDVTVQDVTGKLIQSHAINGEQGENQVVVGTTELASGIYFLKIQTGNSIETVQFVVK